MAQSYIPSVIDSESNLARYLQEIRKFPILSSQEEYNLAKDYYTNQRVEAAHRLVTSHLRLVVKIALGYRNYGLPINEVISEGNIGLMRAVKNFEPDKGFRLATYAMWWIKSSIQEYILRSWSLVKIGTTTSQKKLFFNLRKLKNKMQLFNDNELNHDQVKKIAKDLNINETEILSMDQRLAGDKSLNVQFNSSDSNSLGNAGQWQDFLVDESDNQESLLIAQDEFSNQMDLLEEAISTLKIREQEIFRARRLQEPAQTLEQLSYKYNISRERVRQIENRSFEKVQEYIKANNILN